MDPLQRQRTIRVIGIVAVLALISVFWAMQIARHRRFVSARSKAEPLKTLEGIRLPAGGKQWMNVTYKESALPSAIGTYSVESDCASVITHYKTEFARHGFTDRPYKNNEEPQSQSIAFCGSHYYAILSCKLNKQSQKESEYMIVLQWTGESC